MVLLVRTPSPRPTESLLGFVLRVSEYNGYEMPAYIWQLAQIPRGKELAPGFPIEQLAEILGQDPRELRRIAYRAEATDGRQFKILGHLLGETLRAAPLRLRRPAFCPQCVEVEGYIDAFWDLSAAVACPTHRCAVLRKCPGCSKTLTWRRSAMLTCGCGASLSVDNLQSVDTATCELMEIIKSRVHGHPKQTLATTSGFPIEHLIDLPLAPLLQILESLGSQVLSARAVSKDNEGFAIGEAADALADWPHGYHRALTVLGQKFLGETPSTSGLRKQFGPFYEMMFKNRAFSDHASFLRDEFLKFGQLHWGNALVDDKLLRGRRVEDERRFISKERFARRFRVWKPTMQRLVADGAVITKKIKAGKSTRIVVDLKLSRVPEDSKGLIHGRAAARLLGLPVRVLEYLRQMRVISTKHRRGRAQSWHFADVETFRRRALALAAHGTADSGTVRLEDVMRVKLRDAKAKSDIVAALFDGRLSVRGCTGENLGGLLLEKSQVESFVLQKRRHVERDTYSLQECAVLTGLAPAVIARAIDAELLAGREHKGRLRVTADSVETFRTTYVPLSKVAAELGTSVTWLWRQCREQKIAVVILKRPGRGAPQPLVHHDCESTLLEIWRGRLSRNPERRVDSVSRYEESLRKYLNGLLANAERLPRRKGSPNKVAIARACNFKRKVLYACPSVIRLLHEFDGRERSEAGDAGLSPVGTVKKYLAALRENNLPLPRRNGVPNKLAIARACGVARTIFHRCPEAAMLLNIHAADEALVGRGIEEGIGARLRCAQIG